MSRLLEDIGFAVGLLLAAIYCLAEAAARVGFRLGTSEPITGVPWVTLAMVALCIAPKMVGRSTAGAAWRAIAARFAPASKGDSASDGG